MPAEPMNKNVDENRPAPTDEIRHIAHAAGLSGFKTPTLEAVERRRMQLWILTVLILVSIAVAVTLVGTQFGVRLPAWLPSWVLQFGMLVLVVLFSAYAIEKELQLRRLNRLLVNERVLTVSLVNRIQEVSRLLEAGRVVNLDLDLNEVLGTIERCVRDLLSPERVDLLLATGQGELRPYRGGRGIPINQGIVGQVAARSEPMLVSGTRNVPPQPDGNLDASALEPTFTAMCVPLKHRGELLGILYLEAGRQRPYSEHDLRAVNVFAEQAATAIANSHLYEEQRFNAVRRTFQAQHDPLTRLCNRTLLVPRIGDALDQAQRGGGHVAVLCLDLDDFKTINDTFGHAAGDEVLVESANRLRRVFRARDLLARVGGDEFVVLVDNVREREAAEALAERAVRDLSAPLVVVGGREVRVTASCGFALSVGDKKPELLLREADHALQEAKRSGKSRVRLFDESEKQDTPGRNQLKDLLRGALERAEFELYYQPIVRLADRMPVAVEAFLRWRGPLGEVLPAQAFLTLAMEMGLQPRIEDWVMQEVGPVLRDRKIGLPVHLNVSSEKIRSPVFVEQLRGILGDAKADRQAMILDVSEEFVGYETDSLRTRLAELCGAGVGLALDDFGRGHLSFSQIKGMPFAQLKIDSVFVASLTHTQGSRELVNTMIRLGRGLNMEVVAEGIEHEEEIEALQELACPLGQGMLLAGPMPRADLVRYLARVRGVAV